MDKILEMESSKKNRVEKRGYDVVEGDAAEQLTQSKKPKLPGLARSAYTIYLLILLQNLRILQICVDFGSNAKSLCILTFVNSYGAN